MDWDGIKTQILDDLHTYVTPAAVDELVYKVKFRSVAKAPFSNQTQKVSDVLRGQDQAYLIAENCFHYVFKQLLEVMECGRPYATTDLHPFGTGIMSKLEDGLFVDFLLNAIYTVQDWSSKDAEVKYLSGHPIYSQLLKAHKNGWILHGRITPQHIRGGVERPVNLIKVPKANQIQLEYFYGKTYRPPFPMQRRSQASEKVRFNFPSVARHFDYQELPNELWRNFYIRELHWGTNLAAMMSRYNEIFAPAASRDIYSQIWTSCTSDNGSVQSLIKQLMSIPSPAYRISFMRGVLDHAASFYEIPTAKDWNWTRFIRQYDPNQQLIITDPGTKEQLKSIPLKAAIPVLNYFTLILFVLVWNEIRYNTPTSYTEDSLKKTFCDFLEDSEVMSSFLGYLCYAVQRALEDLFGLPASDSLSIVEERWPLLLLPDHEDEHLRVLMGTRDAVTDPFDINTEVFATLQSICYEFS